MESVDSLPGFTGADCHPKATAKLFRTALKLSKVLQTGLVSKLAGLFERFYSLRAARKFLRPLERLFCFDRQFGLHGRIAGFAQVSYSLALECTVAALSQLKSGRTLAPLLPQA